jgi:aryl-alcohol dehydrogenase-like predicted oxidoreductase
MEYVKLGSTGLDVSRICLGCLNFGEPERGIQTWSMGEESSRPLIRQAVEAGINFFDTANVYSAGSSEEILGRALAEYGTRDELVIATKIHGRMHDGPNGQGQSRKAILTQIDKSLARLGVDYIDLLQPHRWDAATPIEETLETLHDVIKSGKVRYIGASSMFAWQFSKAQYTAKANGWTPFVSMQNHYNLIYREEEREMMPLCDDLGVGVIPWSPLARGKLTRPWDEATHRSELDSRQGLYVPEDRAIVEQVAAIAVARAVPAAQVALAWVNQNRLVSSAIIGASKPHHITDAVASLDIELSGEEIEALEQPYRPHLFAS